MHPTMRQELVRAQQAQSSRTAGSTQPGRLAREVSTPPRGNPSRRASAALTLAPSTGRGCRPRPATG